MNHSKTYASDVAFTPTVKAMQSRKGSRDSYRRLEERGSWRSRITPDLAAFVEAQTSVFLATANLQGQPYVQHRGGPAGFSKSLMTGRSDSPITQETANISRSETSPRIPSHSSFSSTLHCVGASRSGVKRALSKAMQN
jgi:Pyridoxamine 5'-phosphate oxidase